jgi:hypothetical protein
MKGAGRRASGPERHVRPVLTFNGSRARLRRIRFRGNWPLEMWLLVVTVLVALFVLIPRLMNG